MKSITNFFRSVGLPHRDGYKFIAIFFVISVVFFFINNILGFLGLVLTIWCLLFFRDPVRFIPIGDNFVVSPADGIISDISELSLPKELNLQENKEEVIRVSIFMNVFNCHINRSPVKGLINKMCYIPGKFLSADLNKASEENERHIYSIISHNKLFVVVQIAGLIARRIVSFTCEDESLSAGQRIGLIRFGSRVDIYLPKGVIPKVCVGQKSVAGETVIADLNEKKQKQITAYSE